MKAQAATTAFFLVGAIFVPSNARAGDATPLTFDATRNSKTNYSLDWGLRLVESVPVRTGVRIGWATTSEGRVVDVPVNVTAGLGNLDDATAAIRRSVELTAGQSGAAGSASVTAKRIRPLNIAPDLDAELRQTVSTGVRGGASRVQSEVRASQTVVLNDVAPRTLLQTTTTVSSLQKGLSAQLRIERKLTPALSVSANVTHDASTNSARIDARYAWNW